MRGCLLCNMFVTFTTLPIYCHFVSACQCHALFKAPSPSVVWARNLSHSMLGGPCNRHLIQPDLTASHATRRLWPFNIFTCMHHCLHAFTSLACITKVHVTPNLLALVALAQAMPCSNAMQGMAHEENYKILCDILGKALKGMVFVNARQPRPRARDSPSSMIAAQTAQMKKLSWQWVWMAVAAGCCHPWPLALLWLSDIGGSNPTTSSHASVATW